MKDESALVVVLPDQLDSEDDWVNKSEDYDSKEDWINDSKEDIEVQDGSSRWTPQRKKLTDSELEEVFE